MAKAKKKSTLKKKDPSEKKSAAKSNKTAKKPVKKTTKKAAKKTAKKATAKKSPVKKSSTKKKTGGKSVNKTAKSKKLPKALEKAQTLLLEEQAKLRKRIGAIESDQHEGNVGDIADAATQSETRAVMQGLQQTERDQLRQVEDALVKIEGGEYGKCERCDNQIEEARLQALPYVKTCIACKRREESGDFRQQAS